MADPHTDPQQPGQALVLVTDFDGTLYRGDAPIRYYAGQAAAGLAPLERAELLAGVEHYLVEGVAAADRATDAVQAEAFRAAADGWEVVAELGRRRHGLQLPRLNAAFAATRAHMATSACALEVPAGYAELLSDLRADGVRVVLATNSPAAGLDELLDRLQLRPLVDEVVSSTGKPAGLERLLRRELGLPEEADGQYAGAAAARVLSIGDHWRNDIAPAAALGAPCAYIDRFGRADGPATAAAAHIEDLLPALRAWAAGDARTTAPAERN
ncbi:FMN phosphatase YigB (HAD superfamily) [Kitasatospora sp. MAP12-15]|uniref:HAD family hydrolase n=1 Tax=unclassified Kitasatospora TaxID=2633591 RepID=UPI002475A5FB|nr:HAD family hydrolase [Kitasatospora sp. MAP12-44]MDH6109719.1 FMN phosphatase YigB (HAD superfamily) [Kitasatospora sp. MAP12-44]